MRRRRVLMVTASVLGLIAICISTLVAVDIFPKASSQTLASQDQVSAAELSAAIDAQRQVAAKLTRSASFDQRLQKLSEKAQKDGVVSVIVKVRAGFKPEGYITSAAERLAQRKVIEEAQNRLLAGLSYEPSSLKRYDDIPYIVVTMDSYGLAQLQSSADVLDVVANKSMKLATGESLPQIKAGRAWRAGYSGAGKTIVILDSGVDKTHPALSSKVVAEACYSTNDLPGYESLCPGNAPSSTAENSGINCDKPGVSGVEACGHGTHIAGIAAGRSGVAKDANIISIQVMSYVTGGECGFGSCLRSQTDDVMDALDHVYNNLRNSHSIAAVNISLVTDIADSYEITCDEGDGTPLKAKIDQLRSVGIPTVIAAGNDGFHNALGYPACISTSVSVGAVGDGSGDAAADAVWENSNSADYLKLLAPGDGITSAILGGDTASASGTSQAAAHVSGAWAILKQMQPAMSVDDALNRLQTKGAPITDTRNSKTFRRIQIDEALGVTVPEDMWEALYYNNPNLEGIPALTRNEGDGFIDRFFNAGESPVQGIGVENYSVRWIRTPTFTEEGMYRFSVTGDDGVRLYIDGQSKIPADGGWRDQAPTTYNVDTHLGVGNHVIRLEYYQAAGPAQVRLIWEILNGACEQETADDHWKGEYFNNAYLLGDPVIVQDDGINNSLNFNWGAGAPTSSCNLPIFADYFSARWTRRVNLGNGVYRFTVTGDNGVRLKIDDHPLPLIERWTETVGTNTATFNSQGEHKIELEFFETFGDAAVALSWEPLPAPPSNLVASAASDTRINLRWDDNSGNESGFEIERWDGSSYVRINTVAPNVATYTDSGLALSTTYSYRVRAFNSVGVSVYSNESSATTFLPAPSNLVASAVSSSQINLSWIDNSSLENGFKIERWNGSGYAQINMVGANVTTYADSGLPPLTTYSYRVRAFSNIGVDSGYSNESSVTTLACSYSVSPTSLSNLDGGGDFSRRITVTTGPGCNWSAVSNRSWITIEPSISGYVDVWISPNTTGQPRAGSVTIAGIQVSVSQRACIPTCL